MLGLITNRGASYPLTAKGQMQAASLADAFATIGVTRIYSSPLLRARQTADPLSRRIGLSYEVTEALREFDCGVLEGKSDAESWALHNEVWLDWRERGRYDSRIEGGESFLDIRARFEPFVQRLLAELSDDDRVVMVGHGGLYIHMLPALLTDTEFAREAGLPFPNTGYVVAEPRPGGLVCLEWCGVVNGRIA